MVGSVLYTNRTYPCSSPGQTQTVSPRPGSGALKVKKIIIRGCHDMISGRILPYLGQLSSGQGAWRSWGSRKRSEPGGKHLRAGVRRTNAPPSARRGHPCLRHPHPHPQFVDSYHVTFLRGFTVTVEFFHVSSETEYHKHRRSYSSFGRRVATGGREERLKFGRIGPSWDCSLDPGYWGLLGRAKC